MRHGLPGPGLKTTLQSMGTETCGKRRHANPVLALALHLLGPAEGSRMEDRDSQPSETTQFVSGVCVCVLSTKFTFLSHSENTHFQPLCSWDNDFFNSGVCTPSPKDNGIHRLVTWGERL